MSRGPSQSSVASSRGSFQRPPMQVYTTRGAKTGSSRKVSSSSSSSLVSGTIAMMNSSIHHQQTQQRQQQQQQQSTHSLGRSKSRSRSQSRDEQSGNRKRSTSLGHRPPSNRHGRKSSNSNNNNNYSNNNPPQYRVRSFTSDAGSTSSRRVYPESIGSEDLGSVSSAPTYSRNLPFANSSTDEFSYSNSSNLKRNFAQSVVKKYQYQDFAVTAQSQEALEQHVRLARRVIEDLNRAQGAHRRFAAITNACESFDHMDEAKHNIELYHGAGQALAKLLSNDDDENRMVCAALEMVFRASTKSVETAYDRIGNGLLTCLLRLLERYETGNLKHSEISILNISRILLYLSRCSNLRSSLCQHPGLLQDLLRMTSRPLNMDCRQTRVRILSNLANCDDNKIIMFEHPNLLETVLRIAHLDETSDMSRQYAASVLMELASAPANQEVMANQDKVLATLVKMILVEKSSLTRDYVITAIQNLAYAKDNRKRLVYFKQGVVLEALKKALTSDTDPKSRRRAAGALTNLACEETAETMANHKGLLNSLAIVATKDNNMDVQTRAALALSKIAGSVTVGMDCHPTLLDALVVASLSKASSTVSGVLRVKAREPENREALATHPGILDTLADICMSESMPWVDRDNAVRAIMHLVNENKNRKVMCNKTILDALVTAANFKDPDLVEARDSAIRALERLATEVTNRSRMAHHEGLLVAISKAVEREAKWDQAGRESEHGYLAKALLMSLLVAL